MNSTRRGFFGTLLKAAGAFAILPPATTYQRIWKAVSVPVHADIDCCYYGWCGDSLGQASSAPMTVTDFVLVDGVVIPVRFYNHYPGEA